MTVDYVTTGVASTPDTSIAGASCIQLALRLTAKESAQLRRKFPNMECLDYNSVKDNLTALASIAPQPWIKGLILRNPRLLTCHLNSWMDFMSAYGLDKQQIAYLLSQAPQLFLEGSPYNAGRVMLALRGLGLAQHDIITRVIMETPGVLNLDVEADINPILEKLRCSGYADCQISALVWEYPEVLCLPNAADAYLQL